MCFPNLSLKLEVNSNNVNNLHFDLFEQILFTMNNLHFSLGTMSPSNLSSYYSNVLTVQTDFCFQKLCFRPSIQIQWSALNFDNLRTPTSKTGVVGGGAPKANLFRRQEASFPMKQKHRPKSF